MAAYINDMSDDPNNLDQLFSGRKFWVAQRVPSRSRLLHDIRSHGGDVVMLEKQADYLIADHLYKNCSPGSISFMFVEDSIRHGEVRNISEYRCGPNRGEARSPGATHWRAKSSRTVFTAEDDRILYKWVQHAEAAGSLVKGNEIYKQLEAKYPHHPWQSWRDRYVKRLRNLPASAINILDSASPSLPPDSAAQQAHSNDHTLEQLANLFSSDDWEELYAFVDTIDCAAEESRVNGWAAWANERGKQTAGQWQRYYEKVVRPQWLRDPLWKREQVKLKVEQKYNQSCSMRENSDERQDQQQLATLTKLKSQSIETLRNGPSAVEDHLREHDRQDSNRSVSQDLLTVERVTSCIDSDEREMADVCPPRSMLPQIAYCEASSFSTQTVLSSSPQVDPSQLQCSNNHVQASRLHDGSRSTTSPLRYHESDTSTTGSLQEFRQSLDSKDVERMDFSEEYAASRCTSASPTSSVSSHSTDLGDPDVPLEAEEIDDFFEEQRMNGFDDDFVIKALKRTRLRPGLAIQVLTAWKKGDALPNGRGIWSLEDDEAIEDGDGVALARIQKKHTMDGWGGITERLVFLEAYQNR